jgi:integrase
MNVWTDKRDRRVSLPIPSELVEAIAAIPIEDRRYCFPNEREITLSVEKRAKLSVQFGRICKQLELNHTFHDLRHTYATECDEKGIPTEVLPNVPTNGSGFYVSI